MTVLTIMSNLIMKMNNRLLVVLRVLSLAVVIALTAGCKRRVNDFAEFADISPDGWMYGDVVEFNPEPGDSVCHGSLVLSVRHTNLYLYSNLWLEITIADSLSTRVDTVGVTLADPMGNWQGRGIGTDFEAVDTLDADITLHRPVRLSVRHIMRDDCLDDIERIGLTFSSAE